MIKEIFEQPTAIKNAIRGRLDFEMGTAILSGLNLSQRDAAIINRVLVVGCGTSMHAGMVGEYAFEELAVIPAEVEQAAEFRYRNPIIRPSDFVLAISQSGETADTLAAVREAMNKGAMVAGICNVVGSTIARETGRGVYLHAGPEITAWLPQNKYVPGGGVVDDGAAARAILGYLKHDGEELAAMDRTNSSIN